MRLIQSFFNRLRKGDIKNTLYLTYYYLYLFWFDFKNRSNFAFSNPPAETGVPTGGTGNFPAHPRIVKLLIKNLKVDKRTPIIDVGHGSGIALFVAHKMGYTNLAGIEYGDYPFAVSKENIGKFAKLYHGDAFEHHLDKYQVMFFFSPFRGEMCKNYFQTIPSNITKIMAVNVDPIAEPVLKSLGYTEVFNYQHPVYLNFNAKIWHLSAL